MPTIWLDVPMQAMSPTWPLFGTLEDAPYLQGLEGRELVKLIQDILWQCKEDWQRWIPQQEDKGFEYRSVPPNRSFTTQIRYKLCGEGSPLLYAPED